MNNPLHATHFQLWWDHVDGATGKLVRSTKQFKRKEDAATFIRKTPHLIDHGAAGCVMVTESKEVARDGKTKQTTVRQDVWTFDEMRDLARG